MHFQYDYMQYIAYDSEFNYDIKPCISYIYRFKHDQINLIKQINLKHLIIGIYSE